MGLFELALNPNLSDKEFKELFKLYIENEKKLLKLKMKTDRILFFIKLKHEDEMFDLQFNFLNKRRDFIVEQRNKDIEKT